jgi:hypothetical protein
LAVDISKTGQYILLVTTRNVYATDTTDTAPILTFKAIGCAITKSNTTRTITKGSCSFTQAGLATFIINDNTYFLDLTTVTYLSNMVIAMDFESLSINTSTYASTEIGISRVSRLSTANLPNISTYYSKSGTSSAFFTGSSSMVADINLQSSLFTLCAWVFYTKGDWGIIFDLANSANCETGTPSPTKISVGISPYGSYSEILLNKVNIGNTKRSLPNDTWTHIAIVFTNNTANFYINGLLDYSSPYTLNVTLDKLSIGSKYFSNEYNESYPFTGYMDDLRIYNKALTDTDIYNLYALFIHPNMYLSFENGLSDIINEINPANFPEINISNANKKYGIQSLRVNSGKYLAYNYPLVKNTNVLSFTACAWFNADNFSTLQTIFSLYGADPNDNGFSNNWDNNGIGALISAHINTAREVYANFNGNGTITIGPTAISAGWNHVAITFTQNGSFKLYVNGIVKFATVGNNIRNESVSWQGKFTGGKNQIVMIGKYPFSGGQAPFTGYIDDFRIYDHELPSNFISALYNSSAPLYYPITSPNSVFYNVITSIPSTVKYTTIPPSVSNCIYSAMSHNGKYQVLIPDAESDLYYYSNDFGQTFSTKTMSLPDNTNIKGIANRGVYVSNSGRILIGKANNLILSTGGDANDNNVFSNIAPILTTTPGRPVVSIQSTDNFSTIIYGGFFSDGNDRFTFWYKYSPNGQINNQTGFIKISTINNIYVINNRRGITLSSNGDRAVIQYTNTSNVIRLELLYNITLTLQNKNINLPVGCPRPNTLKISPDGTYVLIGGSTPFAGNINYVVNTQIYKAATQDIIGNTSSDSVFTVMPSSPYGNWDTFVINGDNIYVVDTARNVYYSPNAGTTWNKFILSPLYGDTNEFIFSVSEDNNYIFHTNNTTETLYPCLKLNSNSTINTFTSTTNTFNIVPFVQPNKSISQIYNENISYISSSFNASSLVINTNIQTYYTNNTGQTWISLQTGNSTGLPTLLSVNGVEMSSDGSYLILSSLSGLYTLNSNYNTNQQKNSLAIGNMAGFIGQAANAIAIGALAGQTNQPANTIVLNATGTELSPQITNGCFIAPIANYTNSTSSSFNLLGYGTDNQIVKIDGTSSPTGFIINGVLISSSRAKGTTVFGASAYVGSGDQNIAIGTICGNSTMSGDANTLMGHGAGFTLSSGTRNTLIGRGAGQPMTVGNDNTAVGWAAGNAIVDGYSNVMIGSGAGSTIKSGHTNVYIGRGATAYSDSVYGEIVIGQVAGNGNQTVTLGGAQANNLFLNGYTSTSTALTIGTNGRLISGSDRRLKNSIIYLDKVGAIDKILKLKPCQYKFNSDPFGNSGGFIAQDVMEVLPNAVDGRKYPYYFERNADGSPKMDEEGNVIYTKNQVTGELMERYLGLNINEITGWTVLAIQEQQDKIVSLEAQLASLKATVDALVAQKGFSHQTQIASTSSPTGSTGSADPTGSTGPSGSV